MIEEENFLRGYEVSGIELNTRMYKITAVAAVLMIVPMLAISQTNMLAKSACESPFVNDVCEVLDTVYIGSKMLARSASGYEDRDFELAELADAKVIWTQFQENDEPPLEYPVGYFRIANPERYIVEEDGVDTSNAFNPPPPVTRVNPPVTRPKRVKPPARRSPNRSGRKPVYPSKNKNNPTVKEGGSLMERMAGIGNGDKDGDKDGDKTAANDPNNKPEKDPTPNPRTENKVEKESSKDSESEKAFNVRPAKVFGKKVKEQVDNKEISLEENFKVRLEGLITEEGTLADGASPKRISGSDQMTKLAFEAFLTVGETGWLGVLKEGGASKIEMEFEQNDQDMIALVQLPVESGARARALKSILDLGRKQAIKDKKDKKESIERDLLELVEISQDDKTVIVRFKMEKNRAHKLIKAELEKNQKNQENNSAETSNESSKQIDAKSTYARLAR